jgi:hypothetical protein
MEWYHDLTPEQILAKQLYTKKLIMHWGDFHKALRDFFGKKEYNRIWDRADRWEVFKAEFEKKRTK